MRLLIAVTLAIFALTAQAATATAEPTKILPEPTTAKPITGSGSSGAGTIETVKGTSLKCAKTKAGGSFTTSNSGSGSVLFENCTSSQETVCTGVGDATGSVEVAGSVHYLLALEMLTSTTSTLIPAFAVTIPQFHLSCSNVELGLELLVLKRGCIAGKPDGGEVLQAAVTLLFERFTKGEPKILSILMPEATQETKCLLEVSITEEKTGEKFELAVLVGSGTFSSFTQAGTEITVLLMDK
jgi:hypothetical protein